MSTQRPSFERKEMALSSSPYVYLPVDIPAYTVELTHRDPIDGELTLLHNPAGERSLYQQYFHELRDLLSGKYGFHDLSGVVGMGIDCLMDALKHFTTLGDRCANHELAHGHKPVVGVVTAVDLADTGMSCGVFQDYQITREARCVTAGECHQHTVKSRYGDDLHIGYNRNAYFDLLL